jgi:Sec-independent protein translocase protein TatA
LEKILFIGAAVLLIFGPEKVPVIARTLGNLVREFQNALHPSTPSTPTPDPVLKTAGASKKKKRRAAALKKIS